LPAESLIRFCAQTRTVWVSSAVRASIRASGVAPYSVTEPSLRHTVKRCGPVPALPCEITRLIASISVRYSVPSAP